MLTEAHIRRLASINSIEALLAFLRDELDWPLTSDSVEDVTFTYEPEALGLKEEHWPKINAIYQVRNVTRTQPWGIFYIDFENRKLPVTILRRILNHLRLKNKGRSGQWDAGDLLFMTTYGEEAEGMREVAFAHFHQQAGDLPTLNVLQWDAQDTPAKLRSTYDTLKGNLGWPPDPGNADGWREQWRTPFRHKLGHTIRTSKALAEKLAELSRDIRDRVNIVLDAESDKGPMTKLYTAFKEALIHDLKPEDFADTFAQTVTYGLFSAAVSRRFPEEKGSKSLTTETIRDIVPETNPFLREVLATFLDVSGRKGGIDFDELGIQDVLDLLRSDETDMRAILEDFGNRKQGEDPVIHFYEDYLKAYNKELKVKRGVFYTPQPVVSYIVRSVHELLQTEFGLEDGLASTITWAEMVERGLPLSPNDRVEERGPGGEDSEPTRANPGHPSQPEQTRANPPQPAQSLTIPDGTDPDSHFVVILDPATGTATFLVEVIDVIYKHLRAKWDTDRAGCLALLRSEPSQANPDQPEQGFLAFWNSYVPDHLLPRLHGYELMMAPYAIAHMKVGLKLAETGYTFGTDKRVRIYLTNALEPASELQARLALDWEALAHEAMAVKAVKETQRFTVVIGNPPYSIQSGNLTETARQLVEPYKFVDGERIRERNALQFEKNIQDDYVKFLRLAEEAISGAGVGILGYISNDSFLDSRSFRGLRQHLISTFPSSCFLDLHGSQKKGQSDSAGKRDENVFDIQQGVCVSLCRRCPGMSPGTSRSDMLGSRSEKYEALANSVQSDTVWRRISPAAPFYSFSSEESDEASEYAMFMSTRDIVARFSSGIKTHKDHFAYSFTREEMLERLDRFIDPDVDDEALRDSFDLPDTPLWSLATARDRLRRSYSADQIKQSLYRPFDVRSIIFSEHIVRYMAGGTMKHLAGWDNLALLLSQQQVVVGFAHAFITRCLADCQSVSNRSREGTSVFTLYTYPTEREAALGIGKEPNISLAFLGALVGAIGRRFEFEGSPDERATPDSPSNTSAQPTLGDFGSELGSMQGSLAVGSSIDPNAPTFSPEDVFHYIYAVLHSPTYRSRYAEFLKIDFPRIPLPGGPEVFDALVPLGAELVALHLMESPRLDTHITTFRSPLAPMNGGERGLGGEGPRVEKVTFTLQPADRGLPTADSTLQTADCELPTSLGTVWIDKAQTVGFQGVPEEVWNFHIGGYQVCEKWLKDRGPKKGNPGRILTPDDISHYHKIVVALSETIRIMKEIDLAIDAHGGWPGAFRGTHHA